MIKNLYLCNVNKIQLVTLQNLKEMKTIAFYFIGENVKIFDEIMRENHESQNDPTLSEIIRVANDAWGIKVPADADEEECKMEVENMLLQYGFYCGTDYEF